MEDKFRQGITQVLSPLMLWLLTIKENTAHSSIRVTGCVSSGASESHTTPRPTPHADSYPNVGLNVITDIGNRHSSRAPEISMCTYKFCRTATRPHPTQLAPASDCSFLLCKYFMQFLDVFSFCLSLLGICGLILPLRYLLPRNITPLLSLLMNETTQLLDSAEAIGAIPLQSECRTHLDRSMNEFVMMRVESNNAMGTFQQLRLVLRRGLTCRLYSLRRRVEAINSKLELAINERQLSITESATGTVVPGPAATTVTPVNSVTLPLPATSS